MQGGREIVWKGQSAGSLLCTLEVVFTWLKGLVVYWEHRSMSGELITIQSTNKSKLLLHRTLHEDIIYIKFYLFQLKTYSGLIPPWNNKQTNQNKLPYDLL